MTLRPMGLLLALLLATTASLAQKPQAERPTYAVGERWVRNDGVFELIRIEGEHYVFAASADRQVHLTRDLMVARIQKGMSLLEFDPPPKVSWPLEVGRSGASLVNGLKGAADLNRDGIVSLQELYEYAEQQVTAKSRAVGGNQHPVMKGELEGALPLAKVRGR